MKPHKALLIVLLMIPITVGLSTPAPQLSSLPVRKYHILDFLTIYNPEEGQCDDSPLITASNSHIDLEQLRTDKIRWMALSRDLLKRWKGEFNYGDTVMLNAGDPAIDGLWVINDNMNARYTNRGDLLFHRDTRTTGLWKKVKMNRWGRKTIVS